MSSKIEFIMYDAENDNKLRFVQIDYYNADYYVIRSHEWFYNGYVTIASTPYKSYSPRVDSTTKLNLALRGEYIQIAVGELVSLLNYAYSITITFDAGSMGKLDTLHNKLMYVFTSGHFFILVEYILECLRTGIEFDLSKLIASGKFD